MDNPITYINEINTSHALNFLSSSKCNTKTKYNKACRLTKFFYYLYQNDFIDEELVFEYKKDKYGRIYMDNLFHGSYEVDNNVNNHIDVIHEIELKYLPLFFQVAKEIEPDIYLGLFFMFGGGLRASEIVSVEYNNISLEDDGKRLYITIDLQNKDLRPDIKTGFISKVKKTRKQVILPIYGDLLRKAYNYHMENCMVKGVTAVFVNKDKKPMTVESFRSKFNKVKKEVINRLLESNDNEEHLYGVYLKAHKFSVHIGRGTVTNVMARFCSPNELAVFRGDSSPLSCMAYMNDNKTVKDKVINCFNIYYC
jgi:integrase